MESAMNRRAWRPQATGHDGAQADAEDAWSTYRRARGPALLHATRYTVSWMRFKFAATIQCAIQSNGKIE